MAFYCFLFHFTPIMQLPTILICFRKLRENTQNRELLTRKEVQHAVRATLKLFSDVEYFSLPILIVAV